MTKYRRELVSSEELEPKSERQGTDGVVHDVSTRTTPAFAKLTSKSLLGQSYPSLEISTRHFAFGELDGAELEDSFDTIIAIHSSELDYQLLKDYVLKLGAPGSLLVVSHDQNAPIPLDALTHLSASTECAPELVTLFTDKRSVFVRGSGLGKTIQSKVGKLLQDLSTSSLVVLRG